MIVMLVITKGLQANRTLAFSWWGLF